MNETLNPERTIYNRQMAIFIFCISILAKLADLPALLTRQVQSSAFILMAIYCVLEVIVFVFIYLFAVGRGVEYLNRSHPAVKIPIYAILFLLLIFKLFFLSTYAINVVTDLFFDAIDPVIIVMTMFPIIAFMVKKGIQPIARTAEFFFLICFLMIAFIFMFLDTEVNFNRLKPIFTDAPAKILDKGLSVGLFFGDTTSFLLVMLRKHQKNYVPVSLVFSYLLVIAITALSIAIFGNALSISQNIIVELVTYNQIVAIIGRLQWIGLIPTMILITVDLSFLFWGTAEALTGIIKKREIATYVVLLTLLIPLLAISDYERIFEFSTGPVGYISFALSFLLPIVCYIMLCVLRRKYAKVN